MASWSSDLCSSFELLLCAQYWLTLVVLCARLHRSGMLPQIFSTRSPAFKVRCSCGVLRYFKCTISGSWPLRRNCECIALPLAFAIGFHRPLKRVPGTSIMSRFIVQHFHVIPGTYLVQALPQVASLDLAQVVGGIARSHRPRVRVMHVPRKSRSYSDSSLSQLSVGLLDRVRLESVRLLPSSRHRCRRSGPLSVRLSGRAAQRARPWCRRPPGSANSVRQETPTTPAR
jgi:hypothetical protein